VVGERRDLLVRPARADGRHDAVRAGATVAYEGLDRLLTRQCRRSGDLRPDASLPREAVALRADALPRLLPELARSGGHLVLSLLLPGGEGVPRHDLDRSEHLRVLEAAELRALTRVGAGPVCFEPGLVDPSRDRVDLPAER